jgi:hypothetical protein
MLPPRTLQEVQDRVLALCRELEEACRAFEGATVAWQEDEGAAMLDRATAAAGRAREALGALKARATRATGTADN